MEAPVVVREIGWLNGHSDFRLDLWADEAVRLTSAGGSNPGLDSLVLYLRE